MIPTLFAIIAMLVCVALFWWYKYELIKDDVELNSKFDRLEHQIKLANLKITQTDIDNYPYDVLDKTQFLRNVGGEIGLSNNVYHDNTWATTYTTTVVKPPLNYRVYCNQRARGER